MHKHDLRLLSRHRLINLWRAAIIFALAGFDLKPGGWTKQLSAFLRQGQRGNSGN